MASSRTAARSESNASMPARNSVDTELLTAQLRQRALVIAAKIVGTQDAEDMVQNAYLRALKTRHPFAGRSEAFTWFCRVTMNECFQHIRHMKTVKEQTVDEMPEPHARELPADALIFQKENREKIRRAIDHLPRQARADILAVYFEYPDLTVKQVAKIQGKGWAGLKSNTHAGRKKLAEILASEAA